MTNNVILKEKETQNFQQEFMIKKTRVLLSIHNELNKLEKTCCITINKLAKEILKDKSTAKTELENYLFETKIKITMQKQFLKLIQETL